MPRLLLLIGWTLAVGVAASAPVPKDFVSPAAKLERLMGKTVCPPKIAGEFKFDAKGQAARLTAKMPADKFGNESRPLLGLHTQTPAAGDFEMTVAVRVTAPAGPPPRVVTLGGGLFVRDPERKADPFVTVAQHLSLRPPRPGRQGGWVREAIAFFDNNDDYLDEDVPTDPTDPFHFRLTRKGDVFTAAVSPDGKEWREFKPMTVKLPDGVAVGVFCYNRTGNAAEVAFEGFALRPLK